METITESGCDYYISTAAAPTPTNPPISLPSSQAVNGGNLFCLPEHTKGDKIWYMGIKAAETTINRFCSLFDGEENHRPIGPGKAQDSLSRGVAYDNGQPINSETMTVYFTVRFLGGDNCPVLDIGGKDNSSLCKDIFSTMKDKCKFISPLLQHGC